MSEAIKPTPGVWNWDSDPIKGDPLGRVRYRVVTIGKTITQCYYSSSDEHAKDDTRLIAEAGTVFHETGLTPRQLVERVKELGEALRVLVAAEDRIDNLPVCPNTYTQESVKFQLHDAMTAARAALSKALPNTVAEVK